MPFFLRGGWPAIISSLVCIVAGLLIGFIILLCINSAGAVEAMGCILKNFAYFHKPEKAIFYFGSTLVKTVPLLMCGLGVLFAYKCGLFNIGVAGQYVAGVAASLWCALGWGLPWYLCILAAMIVAAVCSAIIGALKAYRNVNEVISGIMLNWIILYLTNFLLTKVKDPNSQFTMFVADTAPQAKIPSLFLSKVFSDNPFVCMSIPLAGLAVVAVWLILKKTRLGYELRATGFNRDAAFYCGMKEKRNLVMTMIISGALAGLGAALYYLTDIEQWAVSTSAVPGMGFDGIAAAFLGGMNPVGTVFASYFIKHITIGGLYIDKSVYSPETANVITSVIVYFCAFAQFFRRVAIRSYQKKLLQKKQEEKTGGETA